MNLQQKDALKWLIYKHIHSASSDVISQLLLKKADNVEYGELSYDERSVIRSLYEKESTTRAIILDSSRIPHLRQIQALLNGWAVA